MIRDEHGQLLFSLEEIACRHCGIALLGAGFASRLRALRIAFGRPMQVNSCCRCEEHNQLIGGHPRSLHVFDGERALVAGGTVAIDIATPDEDYRRLLEQLAWDAGWSIGFYSTFMHLDRRDLAGLPQAKFQGGY